MVRSEIIIGDAQVEVLTALRRREFIISQQIKFRSLFRLVFRSIRVEQVVNENPTVLMCRHKVLRISISRSKVKVVTQDASLEEIHNLLRELNVAIKVIRIVFRMI